MAEHSQPIVLANERPFALGRLTVVPATRSVREGSRDHIVEPRVMQVLVALAAADGEVVNRDELIARCWDGRIVGEDAINRVLGRLRRLAENCGRDSFVIETITKVGYRLRTLDEDGGRVERALPFEQGRRRRAAELPSLAKTGWANVTGGEWTPAILLAGALAIAFAVTWASWPDPTAKHSKMVHLTGFRTLSGELPPYMHDSVEAEIVAAFHADGVIGVSTASASGPAPAYTLGGTIERVGPSIRVISRLTNGRTGTVLWSDRVDYPADRRSDIPGKVAVDVGTVVRCGLFGASTYKRPLPDAALANYMQYCQEYWAYGGTKTLRFAQLVVNAVPDFSWGWSAVGNGYMQAAMAEQDSRRAELLRAAGRRAEDRAIALDPRNSEALAHKAYLIDERDWVGQEALFKRAIAANPLDCGCEHFGYGLKLAAVGRTDDAIEQFRAATDMLALWHESQLMLATALVASGRQGEAAPHLAAAAELSTDFNTGRWLTLLTGVETNDYDGATSVLRDPQFIIGDDVRAALLAGYSALQSGQSAQKLDAIRLLLALPDDQKTDVVAVMLGALGADREALMMARRNPALLWRRSMVNVLDEPAAPAVMDQLGLMTYWRTTRTRPDVCTRSPAPQFCRSL